MNFWQAQKRARSKTKIYLTVFILLTLAMTVLVELGMHYFLGEEYQPPVPIVGLIFLAMTFLVAGFQYFQFRAFGGSYVAESLGAKRVDPMTTDSKERQLLNIVEETALASSLPVPPIYIIPADQINAFAAGLHPTNAVVAITRGALNTLSRDEVAGVIAHEFGHIYNGDMKINLRLAAMIMGFFFILILGMRTMQFTALSGGRQRNGRQGANPVLLAAILLMVAGVVTWFAGKALQAMVSRQREYLADACAVQFTRQPWGIANALKKIAKEHVHDMPSSGMAYSHLYFSFQSGLFATHPPIKKRIEAILGMTWLPEEWKKSLQGKNQ